MTASGVFSWDDGDDTDCFDAECFAALDAAEIQAAQRRTNASICPAVEGGSPHHEVAPGKLAWEISAQNNRKDCTKPAQGLLLEATPGGVPEQSHRTNQPQLWDRNFQAGSGHGSRQDHYRQSAARDVGQQCAAEAPLEPPGWTQQNVRQLFTARGRQGNSGVDSTPGVLTVSGTAGLQEVGREAAELECGPYGSYQPASPCERNGSRGNAGRQARIPHQQPGHEPEQYGEEDVEHIDAPPRKRAKQGPGDGTATDSGSLPSVVHTSSAGLGKAQSVQGYARPPGQTATAQYPYNPCQGSAANAVHPGSLPCPRGPTEIGGQLDQRVPGLCRPGGPNPCYQNSGAAQHSQFPEAAPSTFYTHRHALSGSRNTEAGCGAPVACDPRVTGRPPYREGENLGAQLGFAPHAAFSGRGPLSTHSGGQSSGPVNLPLHSRGVLQQQGRAGGAEGQSFSTGQARGSQGPGPGFQSGSFDQPGEAPGRAADVDSDLDDLDDFKRPTRPPARPSGSAGVRQRHSGGLAPSTSGRSPQNRGSVAAPSSGPPCASGPLVSATITLGPPGFISVSTSPNTAISTALKKHGGIWAHQAKQWRLPVKTLDVVMKDLANLPTVRCQVEGPHAVAMRIMKAAGSMSDESERYATLPKRLEGKLMAFQREGVKFVLARGGRALIGDEMGLGKTVQAVAVMAAFKDEWPCLIITPSSLREAWGDALHEWLGVTEDKFFIIRNGKDGHMLKCAKFDYRFLIMSYEFVSKFKEELAARDFKIVVVDESHYIKNGKAQRSKDTIPIIQAAKRALLLSGTPALARPKELLPQLQALLPSAKLKVSDYGGRYCLAATTNRFNPQWGKYDGASNLEELNCVLTSAIMVRRLKNDVLTQLPKKRRQQVHLSLEPEEKKQLGQVADKMAKLRNALQGALDEGGEGGQLLKMLEADQRQTTMELYRKNAEIKGKAVQKYIEELIEADIKFLAFGVHRCMLDSMCFVLNRKKIKYMRIDGDVSQTARHDMVTEFQTNSDMRAAVLSIKAAGVGLTLTGASTVVFAEYSWTPGDMQQAEDRVHRIGQAQAVNIYNLHLKGSVDDIIWATLKNKLDHVGQALDGKADTLEVSCVRSAPVAGQTTLTSFLKPSQPLSD